jgi:hypothetical protein
MKREPRVVPRFNSPMTAGLQAGSRLPRLAVGHGKSRQRLASAGEGHAPLGVIADAKEAGAWLHEPAMVAVT